MRLMQSILAIFLAMDCFAAANANEVKVSWLSDAKSQSWTVAKQFIEDAEDYTEKTTLLYETEISFDQQNVTRTVRQVNYFPTYNETHADGNENIYWDQEIESLTILDARVLTLKGESHRLNPKNIRVLDSDAYNTFTDEKKVVLPYSGLQDKSLSILEYSITFSLSKLESPWSTMIYPVVFEPVKKFRLKVTEDPRTPLTWWGNVKDIMDCQVTDTELLCLGVDLKAHKPDSDVMWRDVLPQIAIAQTHTWDQVIEHNLNAFSRSENKSEPVKELLGELIRPTMSDAEKIAAVHQFVSRDIRYISMSELGHRITPHSAASVVKNRFGDCKDKSALLHGLLNLIGIEATPVLVATERSALSNTRLPSAGYFDHMVVCFDHEDKRYCLDPTDSSTDYTSVSSWIQGRVALNLVPGSTPSHIPESEYRWRIDVITSQTFDEKANVKEMQKRTYHAAYAALARSSLTSKNAQERNQALTESYHSTVSNQADPSFDLVGLNQMSDTFEIHSDAQYKPFLDPKEALNFREYDAWVKSELTDLEISTKYHDAQVKGLYIHSKVDYDFSTLWSISWYPANLNLKGKFGEMTRTVELIEQGKVRIETQVKIAKQTVAQDQIEDFNEFLKLLKTESIMSFDGKALSS